VVRNVVRLLRVREVAELLSVCTATVYGLLRAGELESLWVGASLRVPMRSVEEFMVRGGAGGRPLGGGATKAK
jgi:excisionase family DNA binding protein